MAEQTKHLDIMLELIDVLLPLDDEGEKEFQRLLSELPPEEQKAIDDMLTGWQTRCPLIPEDDSTAARHYEQPYFRAKARPSRTRRSV